MVLSKTCSFNWHMHKLFLIIKPFTFIIKSTKNVLVSTDAVLQDYSLTLIENNWIGLVILIYRSCLWYLVATVPPHQLRISYTFTIVFVEELCLLLLLTVDSNTFAKFELGCLHLSMLLYGWANFLKGGDIPRVIATPGGDIPRNIAPLLRGGGLKYSNWSSHSSS